MVLLLSLCLTALPELLSHYVADPSERSRLTTQLAAIERDLQELAPLYHNEVIKNLENKRHLKMSATEIKQMVFDYEAFKLTTYIRSGVFPKRYFGYLDGKHDTADYERRLKETTRKVVAVINARQGEVGSTVKLTDIEVVTTFLAEGGALFLGEGQDMLQSLHPVFSVGLDDVAMGFSDLGDLQSRVDKHVGTSLGGLVAYVATGQHPSTRIPQNQLWLKHSNGAAGPHAYLTRYMTFEEAVAGTALMYTWEKEIAAKKMAEIKAPSFEKRPLDEQFIIASLVYNSGILHSPQRWEMIRTFSTGDWLYKTSEANAQKRWRLNVFSPEITRARMLDGEGYSDQPTAWLAVYHVLQRYGAFVATRRFSNVFNADGSFK